MGTDHFFNKMEAFYYIRIKIMEALARDDIHTTMIITFVLTSTIFILYLYQQQEIKNQWEAIYRRQATLDALQSSQNDLQYYLEQRWQDNKSLMEKSKILERRVQCLEREKLQVNERSKQLKNLLRRSKAQ